MKAFESLLVVLFAVWNGLLVLALDSSSPAGTLSLFSHINRESRVKNIRKLSSENFELPKNELIEGSLVTRVISMDPILTVQLGISIYIFLNAIVEALVPQKLSDQLRKHSLLISTISRWSDVTLGFQIPQSVVIPEDYVSSALNFTFVLAQDRDVQIIVFNLISLSFGSLPCSVYPSIIRDLPFLLRAIIVYSKIFYGPILENFLPRTILDSMFPSNFAGDEISELQSSQKIIGSINSSGLPSSTSDPIDVTCDLISMPLEYILCLIMMYEAFSNISNLQVFIHKKLIWLKFLLLLSIIPKYLNIRMKTSGKKFWDYLCSYEETELNPVLIFLKNRIIMRASQAWSKLTEASMDIKGVYSVIKKWMAGDLSTKVTTSETESPELESETEAGQSDDDDIDDSDNLVRNTEDDEGEESEVSEGVSDSTNDISGDETS